jgi:predicted ribosomally synthesized peptide with SipW-like signal peptide
MLMRAKNMLLTAAVIGAAVVAGLLGVGGTWALWNAAVQSNPGTVTAARFDVTVNKKSMAQNGWTVTVDPVENSKPLTPAQPVYAALTIKNTTDASGPFSIAADPEVPEVSATGGLRWPEFVNVRTVPFESPECQKASYSSTAFTDPPTRTISKNGTQTYCLEVSFKPSVAPPVDLVDKTFTVDVRLNISQLQGGA